MMIQIIGHVGETKTENSEIGSNNVAIYKSQQNQISNIDKYAKWNLQVPTESKRQHRQ